MSRFFQQKLWRPEGSSTILQSAERKNLPAKSTLPGKTVIQNGRREKEYHPPPHTYPQLKLQTQTASNISSDPTFQMGLSPASFKLLPGVACLHLSSLHTSWICSPLHSGLFTSETCFLGHRHLLIPNQPTTLRGLTFSFALNRPVLSQVCTLSPPLFPCCSLCVSSACLLSQLSL